MMIFVLLLFLLAWLWQYGKLLGERIYEHADVANEVHLFIRYSLFSELFICAKQALVSRLWLAFAFLFRACIAHALQQYALQYT
jgi:hypothetical protein